MSVKTNDLFGKIRSKFPKRQEGDGHENKVEVREDEDQSVKLQEIIDLLVAAGYFRARIKGLSPFDKVVGGMTWCIESCNVEVDVDLLFQENSTIGQKIALTEKIVVVLPKLKCPHHIEPHQIQGLDFIHIFPVIQWLVKRSLEFRTDTADSVYSYALYQFNKDFPQNLDLTEKQQQMLKSIKMVNEIYKPHKIYRRRYALSNKDGESKVQITLLEFDRQSNKKSSSEVKQSIGIINDQNLVEHDIQELMSDITITEEESFDCDNLTEQERERLFNNYKTSHVEIKSEDKQIEELKEKKLEITKKLEKLEGKKIIIDNEITKIKEFIEETEQEYKETESSIKDFELKEDNSENLKETQHLIIESDNLKKQEQEFKEKCRNEHKRLESLIEEAKISKSQSFDEKEKEIENKIDEQKEKLKILRLQVAKKSRTVSALQRKIDNIPSRPELAQYQKRFIELYNQISAKHKETKQYYSLYNTLEDTRQYMKKELSLLNSISDSYPEAMKSKEGKEEFLHQFMNILDGVKQSKQKLDKSLKEEKNKRDELSQSLHSLVELNRKYVASIKQLKLEFHKNEALLAKINSNSP